MSANGLIHDLQVEQVPVSGLRTYHQNPRLGDVDAIRRSLVVNGQYRPIVVNRGTHTGRPKEVLAGNHTLMAARDADWPDIAVCWVDVDSDQAARIVAADNRTTDLGSYDEEMLATLLTGLPDLEGTGFSDADLAALLSGGGARPAGVGFGTEAGDGTDTDPAGTASAAWSPTPDGPTLADRFLIPPFSVLDARSGWWRERKRRWLAAGISSHEGRAKNLTWSSPGAANPDYYKQKAQAETLAGRTLTASEFDNVYAAGQGSAGTASGTSVFDPVLAEMAYRWFSPPGGAVLDPWAGGSVRGLVAAYCGRPYTGVELRAEQIAANEAQRGQQALPAGCPAPVWRHGDAAAVLPLLPPESFDFVFGCPPYFDLEKYSDEPADLSAMNDVVFRAAYTGMIAGAAAALRPDRFAALVVSNVRNARTGELRDLRGLTVEAAAAAGLHLYNEAILVSPVGSLRIRAARMFTATRVIGRTHQELLVFVKGDRKQATLACGEVDPADLEAALAGVATDDDADDDQCIAEGGPTTDG